MHLSSPFQNQIRKKECLLRIEKMQTNGHICQKSIKQDKNAIHVMVAPVKSFPIDPTFPFRRRVNAKDMMPIVRVFRDRVQDTWLRSTWLSKVGEAMTMMIYWYILGEKSLSHERDSPTYISRSPLKCTQKLTPWYGWPPAAMRKCHKAHRWSWSPLPSKTSESLIYGNEHCKLSLPKLIGDSFRPAESFPHQLSAAQVSGLRKVRARSEGIPTFSCPNRFQIIVIRHPVSLIKTDGILSCLCEFWTLLMVKWWRFVPQN